MDNKHIPEGIYLHYKGGRYEVIGTAIHTETGEELVVYRDVNNPEKAESIPKIGRGRPGMFSASYFRDGLWVRPVAMWGGEVEVDGKKVPRFKRL